MNKEIIPLFHNYFTSVNENHGYETKNDCLIRTLRSRTSIGEKRIKSSGCTLWNQNSIARKYMSYTIETFKHKLKDFFIDNYHNQS